MPDDAQICGCNGVSKGTHRLRHHGQGPGVAVAGARPHQGLGLLRPVHQPGRSHPGRHAGRRGGEEGDPPICECTDAGHDAVRQAILAQGLKTMGAVRAAFGWKKPEGCHKCRPALNYYLICAWPGEYPDDSRSRFINERVHANIQKDGTY